MADARISKDDLSTHLEKNVLDASLLDDRKFRSNVNKEEAIARIRKAVARKKTLVDESGAFPSSPAAVAKALAASTPTTDPGTRMQGTSRTERDGCDTADPGKRLNLLGTVRSEMDGSVRRALGRFDDGKLIETREFAHQEADVTAQLLSEGVKMPQHVPLCTPSFAVYDLAAQRDEEGKLLNEDGIDDKAGRDPWAIMDYVRDYLRWPQDAVFIDKEVFGHYAHPGENFDPEGSGVPAGEHLPKDKWDRAISETYVEDGSVRPWCETSPAGGWPVQYRIMSSQDKTKEADAKDQRSWVQRNYRGVYKWAQRVSPCLIFFMSKGWLESENCTIELADLSGDLAEAEPALAERLVVLMQLDDDPQLADECTKQMRQLKSTSGSGVRFEHIDVSGYMAWLEKGEKRPLKEASRGIQRLCELLEERFGHGDLPTYEAEKAERRAEHEAPHVVRADLKGLPVRNRYLSKYQRRINLNGVSAETLHEKLPNVGAVKAERIYEFIRSRRGIVHLSELEEIKGVGKTTLADIEPFVTTEGAFQSPPFDYPISWPHDPKLAATCFRAPVEFAVKLEQEAGGTKAVASSEENVKQEYE